MNDNLYYTQVNLEEEMRNLSISRFLKDHTQGDLSDTVTGSFLLRSYILPLKQAIDNFLVEAKPGKAGRHNIAYKCLSLLPSEVAAYLFIKTFLARAPLYSRENVKLSVTSMSVHVGSRIHEELRIRKFESENAKWLKTIWSDFERRELPRYKRVEYLQKTISDAGEDWSLWSESDKLHVGLKLLDLFIQITGDASIVSVRGKGRHKIDLVVPSDGLLAACERIRDDFEDITALWYPMVHKPIPWSAETLERGGYLSHHVTPYPLVKGSRKAYRRMLRERAESGQLDPILRAINALQETPWKVNKRALEVVSFVYENNIECGKLPRSDVLEPDPPPYGLEKWHKDDPRLIEYLRYRATVHEYNRRSVGKRVMAIRSIHMAERFSQYEAIYFPHDLDSRGRAYPKPNPLNPQGPDFVKGLLQFSTGKVLGRVGLWWLGVHGANCFGEDKVSLEDRAAWSQAHIEEIQAVAADPQGNLWWTKADAPVQFLAFCLEYAEAVKDPDKFVSYLHVDLDATCSGLQHFSAMLRDEVGGFHVNMVPGHSRQDVYGAVAQQALLIFQKEVESKGDRSGMAQAWLESGLMDRKTAKRPVMVKPYAGTRQSCTGYVRAAVDDKLKEGHPLPWAKDDMFNFKLYGGLTVWDAIPKVVVAADAAMQWLSAVSRAVGRSQPNDLRIEWETPLGFPVWQYKFDMKSRRVKTHLDGAVYWPRLREETNKLDSRQMASSTPPSFVHSLDACHLQWTVDKALDQGIDHFAMVHDSFGVHAADVPKFTHIIREAFVEMYQHDVLANFYESALPFIDEKELSAIPPMPSKGNLDLSGVLSSEFFFS